MVTTVVDFMDHQPIALAIAAIMGLVAIVGTSVIATLQALNLWLFAMGHFYSSLSIVLVAFAPFVIFGQVQYRKARRSCLALEELNEQLAAAHMAAEKANQAKSSFLASASHELRTPLNAIIGFSEVLKNEAFGSIAIPRYVEYAGDIHRSGTHLLAIINDLLDLAKIESGKIFVDTSEEVSIAAAIADACETVGLLARNNGVVLEVTLSRNDILVSANSRVILQILTNLLSNAIKFTPRGGTVHVSARRDPSMGVVVEVADTGIGMTAEEIGKALLPFGQIDNRISRGWLGTGLGLPLAKSMIELHGGHLTIRSVPNEGTVMSFNLPVERSIDPRARQRAGGMRRGGLFVPPKLTVGSSASRAEDGGEPPIRVRVSPSA